MAVLGLGLRQGQLLHGTPFSSFQQFTVSCSLPFGMVVLGLFPPSLAEVPHAAESGVHSSAAAMLRLD